MRSHPTKIQSKWQATPSRSSTSMGTHLSAATITRHSSTATTPHDASQDLGRRRTPRRANYLATTTTLRPRRRVARRPGSQRTDVASLRSKSPSTTLPSLACWSPPILTNRSEAQLSFFRKRMGKGVYSSQCINVKLLASHCNFTTWNRLAFFPNVKPWTGRTMSDQGEE